MNKERIVLFIFLIFFVLFIGLYIAESTGYYSNRLKENMILTEEQIEIFEQDIKEGKEIDINSYVINNIEKYTNKTSKTMFSISNKFCDGVTEIIKFIFREVSSSVEDA